MGKSALLRVYVEEVLQKYPELRLQPSAGDETVLAGSFEFSAQARGHVQMSDCYEISISVASNYPRTVPLVREMANRIPCNFHKLDSGHLCLGSPTRLRLILAETPSLLSFIERCLVPYLYGYSTVEGGGDLPFGELSHGVPGLRDDLASVLGVETDKILIGFVRLLASKKRKANKLPCPCGSGMRLGQCHNRIINRVRSDLGRGWFSSLLYGSR